MRKENRKNVKSTFFILDIKVYSLCPTILAYPK